MDSAARSRRASDRLAALLRHLPPPPPLSSGLKLNPNPATNTGHRESHSVRAAVLVCLFEGDAGDLRVILIKRATTLSSHAGEVALPGGKREEGDADDVETALREAREEIGLDPSLVQVLSLLPPFVSVRGISVTPVITLLLDREMYRPVPDPTEVELILDAPLEMFLKDVNRRDKELEVKGHKSLLHFFDYQTEDDKYVIFALTAAILISAASVVYKKEPEFVVRSPKLWH